METQPLVLELILELQRLYVESCLDKSTDSFKFISSRCRLLIEEVSPPGEEWKAVWCASKAAIEAGADGLQLLGLAMCSA